MNMLLLRSGAWQMAFREPNISLQIVIIILLHHAMLRRLLQSTAESLAREAYSVHLWLLLGMLAIILHQSEDQIFNHLASAIKAGGLNINDGSDVCLPHPNHAHPAAT